MKSIVRLIILFLFCSVNVAGWDWGNFFCSFLSLWCPTPAALQPQAEETNNKNTVKFDLNRLIESQSFECVSKSPYHTWYQTYRNGIELINIGNIHFDDDGKHKTQFILTVETFDNDSEIQCYKKKKQILNNSWKLQVTGTSTEMKKYEIFKYNEKHNVASEYMKSCYKSYNNEIFLGVINTTSNRIKIYDINMIKKVPPKFDKTHNGSILCCIKYYRKQTSGTEGRITRYVEKKTLLVYDDTDQQHSLEDTEKRKEEIHSEFTTEDVKGTDAGTRNDDANLDSQQAKPGNQVADSSNQYADSSKTLITYIVSAVAGVLMLLVIVIIIKRRKNPKSRVEEEPRVLYAELDLLRQHESGSFPKEGPEEESPYAEIIGEIRPR